MQVCPSLTRTQAKNHTQNTLLPKARKAGLLTGSVKAQPSTANRSNVTVAQQFRWFVLVGDADLDPARWLKGKSTKSKFVLT